MSTPSALKFLLSFFRFVAREAPTLLPEVARLVRLWSAENGVPNDELEAALDPNVTADKVADADREVNALIDDLWPKKP